MNPGGAAGGGGNSNNNAQPPTADELKLQLKDKPFALIPDIPCEVIKKWIATAKHAGDILLFVPVGAGMNINAFIYKV